MSRASERKRMIEAMAGYSLMSIPDAAALMGCDEDTMHRFIADGVIPTITVGKRQKVDPIDVAVHVLAEKEGTTSAAYWTRYGEAVAAKNARRYCMRVGMFMGAA